MSTRELLIVDDDTAIHEGLLAFCKERDISAHAVQDGALALEFLSENPQVRVVLCDIRIPGLSGLDVLRELRKNDPAVQVVLMTAFGEKQLAIQALRLGADDFLEKPIRLSDLGQILERCFNRIRLQQFSTKWLRVLEHLPVGFVWCQSDGKIEGMTSGVPDMLSRKTKDLDGKVIWRITELRSLKALFGNVNLQPMEVGVAGRWLLAQRIENHAHPEKNVILLSFTDVTEQKALQQELSGLTSEFEAKVEERTRSLSEEVAFSERLLDTADVLIAYVNPAGRLERFNQFAEALTGYTVAEAEIVFNNFARGNTTLAEVFNFRSHDEFSGIIAELPVKDGGHRVVSWSARRLKERSGKYGRLIIGIDVTEQKQLEATLQNYNLHLEEMVRARSTELSQKDAQLIHSARLASLGEMVASIAHEMKQPLNVISITADLIKLLHKNGNLNDENLILNLNKIRLTVDRMATTINHLRGFTHIDSANFEEIKLDDAVRGALSILGEQLRLDDIDIVVDVPSSLPPTRGEKNQIEQVIVNLIQNARDAMVEAATKSGKKKRPKTLSFRGSLIADISDLLLEIEDTGTGMPPDVAAKVFEPFFTTKDADRGTGLGLPISLNIIRSHGGDIEIESKPGQGTIFRILLPVAGSFIMANEPNEIARESTGTV